jgi:hypothetical protein
MLWGIALTSLAGGRKQFGELGGLAVSAIGARQVVVGEVLYVVVGCSGK